MKSLFLACVAWSCMTANAQANTRGWVEGTIFSITANGAGSNSDGFLVDLDVTAATPPYPEGKLAAFYVKWAAAGGQPENALTDRIIIAMQTGATIHATWEWGPAGDKATPFIVDVALLADAAKDLQPNSAMQSVAGEPPTKPGEMPCSGNAWPTLEQLFGQVTKIETLPDARGMHPIALAHIKGGMGAGNTTYPDRDVYVYSCPCTQPSLAHQYMEQLFSAFQMQKGVSISYSPDYPIDGQPMIFGLCYSARSGDPCYVAPNGAPITQGPRTPKKP